MTTCNDCAHLWPKLKTTARCENHRAAGLRSPWLALAGLDKPQDCPGFAPLVRSPQPETETHDRF